MGIISRDRASQKRKALQHLSLKHSVRECHRRRHADKELVRLRHQEENGALRRKLEEAETRIEQILEAQAKAPRRGQGP